MRSIILRNIIFASFALIVLDLFYLQVIRGGYFYKRSLNNSLRVVSVDGPRGRILDRNGRVLAESVKGFDVAVIPQDIKNKKILFGFIAGILNMDSTALERRFDRNRVSPFSPVFLADGLSREDVIRISEGAYLYPGLVVSERYHRRYLQGEIGAHLLGYVGKIAPDKLQELVNNGISVPEQVGYTGIEESLDEKLRGEPGGREVEVNSRGREVRVLSVNEPVMGSDVVLTIDQRIQAVAYDALAGQRGAFVMLDPSNGEVLASISSPSYDPNAFSDPDRRRLSAGYLSDTRSPMINRSFGASFTPGSVFKIPVAFAALEQNKIKPSTTFNCPGYFQLGDRRFSFAHAYGQQNLIEAMAHSANEYFFYSGLMLGPELIIEYARRFGLGERTGIDIGGEAKGNLPSSFAKGWFRGDTANISIGQGAVLATPLQMARMIAAVENGGRILRPRVVKSVGGEDVCVDRQASALRVILHSSCSAPVRVLSFRSVTWNAIREALRAVVKMPTGTANALNIPGFDIYGKTGTAQTVSSKGDHAWFAGIVRGSKQTVSFCLFLEHGGSSHNAVNVARDILLRLQEDGLI